MKQFEIILTKYVPAFTKKLDDQLSVYTTIGTPGYESPMWFQYKGIRTDDVIEDWRDMDNSQLNSIFFRSSQMHYMFFNIQVEPQEAQLLRYYFHDVYEFFKEVKYQHIEANWPTVYNELRRHADPSRSRKR